VLKEKSCLGHLRSKRSMRRSRPVDPNGDKTGTYQGYRLNPSATGGRLKIGRCLVTGRADLQSGPNNTYIATLGRASYPVYVMCWPRVARQGTPRRSSPRSSTRRGRSYQRSYNKSLTWGPGQGTYGSSSLYVGDQHRRLFFAIRKARGNAGRNENTKWPAEKVLS